MSKSRCKLIKDLDKIFSKYIRLRDKECVICGSRENLQNGHYITRSAMSTRWDEVNCNAQCQYHNSVHEVNEIPYRIWFIEKYGKDVLFQLTKKANQVKKYHAHELGMLIKYYKNKVDQIAKSSWLV